MNPAYDLIAFDLDGTLVDTAPEITDALNDTLRHFNFSPMSQQAVTLWIGHGTRELLVQALASAMGTSVAVVRESQALATITAEFDIHYAHHCGAHSLPYPGVMSTLRALKAAGVKLAVVTNKELAFARRVLDAHGLTPLLDRVVGGDSLPTKKPDPAGLLACIQATQARPGRTLFVGDSSIDAATARNAGVPVWLLDWGYNMGQPVSACQPDRVISSLDALALPA